MLGYGSTQFGWDKPTETLPRETDAMECPHGVNLGDPGGRDRMCALCEIGDEGDLDGSEDGPTFRLTIAHDDFPHDPPDADTGLYKVHSFNNNHRSFTHPNEVLACVVCGDQRDEYHHTNVPQVKDEWGDHETLAREYRERNPEDSHDYQIREGFILSYFEHGNCRWGLAGTMSGTPDFQWDGTEFAGFLEVDPTYGEGEDREWYDSLSDDEKTKMAEGFLEEYTAWCNGEVYGYVFERINPEKCNLGHTHESPTDIDSCWGFIGFDYFQEAVREVTSDAGATEDNTEVVDEAHGMADYGKFFADEKTEAMGRVDA